MHIGGISGKHLSDEVMDFVFDERGISNEVSSIAEDVSSRITNDIQERINQEGMSPYSSVHFKDGFVFEEYGIRFSVEWHFYNAGSPAEITQEMITFASANITKGIIRVSLIAIRFHYDTAYFKETIQHEVMHYKKSLFFL